MFLPPSRSSQALNTAGTMVLPVKSTCSGFSAPMIRFQFSPSPGPVKPRRHVPPYLPMAVIGLRTSGSSGTRCSTGGNLPALTISASIGDSPSFAGRLASFWISGPSILPMSVEPSFASGLPEAAAGAAGLAASAGFAAAGAAGLAASAGLAGAVVAAGAAGLVSAGLVAGADGAQAASSPMPATPSPRRRKPRRDTSLHTDMRSTLQVAE